MFRLSGGTHAERVTLENLGSFVRGGVIVLLAVLLGDRRIVEGEARSDVQNSREEVRVELEDYRGKRTRRRPSA